MRRRKRIKLWPLLRVAHLREVQLRQVHGSEVGNRQPRAVPDGLGDYCETHACSKFGCHKLRAGPAEKHCLEHKKTRGFSLGGINIRW